MMPDALHIPIPLILAEIQTGEGLSLAAAGRLFPGSRGRRAVDPSTVYRWCQRGSRGADGAVVRLEAVRVGSRWLTSASAIARYVAALSGDSTSTIPVSPRSIVETNLASETAAEKLKRMGA